jgi:hypothetical protein
MENNTFKHDAVDLQPHFLRTIPGHVLVYSELKFGPKTGLEAVTPGKWSNVAWYSGERA